MSGPVRTDVLVVGGGPVGLAAALHARRAGHDVLVVDRRTGVIDKACGEGLLPGALAAVRELGVDPPGHPLTGISYRDARRHADHAFDAGPGRGVRRTALHAALRERALAAGVVIEHATVRTLHQDAHGVDVEVDRSHDGHARADDPGPGPGAGRRAGLRADWVLGCDGLHSTVRRLTGLDAPPRGRTRYGLRTHYRLAPWTDLVEVHWAAAAEAYVTPVAPDVVGVAVLGPRGPGDPDAFGELAERLRGAPVLGRVRGAGPLRQRARRRTAGRVRLVGDASGYVDALTGEGVRVGLAQAAAVVHHLADADAYERAWARATRDYRVLTSGLLAWAGSPARRAIVPAASAAPWLYAAVVERLAR